VVRKGELAIPARKSCVFHVYERAGMTLLKFSIQIWFQFP
jgi:hypothetical protein